MSVFYIFVFILIFLIILILYLLRQSLLKKFNPAFYRKLEIKQLKKEIKKLSQSELQILSNFIPDTERLLELEETESVLSLVLKGMINELSIDPPGIKEKSYLLAHKYKRPLLELYMKYQKTA